jgi:glycerol kinase
MTHGEFIVAIDQGTTSSRVVVVNSSGQIVSSSSYEFPQYFPKQGWVEHNAEEIWQSVQKSMGEALKDINLSKIAAIGITNQRETVVAWDKKTLDPIGPAIVWQCRRTTEMCQKLQKNSALVRKVRNTTGLLLDPYFSGTKMLWMLQNYPQARKLQQQGRLAFGTIDSFLVARMTGGASHVTDVTNASRTLLMNLKTLDYDTEMLRAFKVKRESLPEVLPSAGKFGVTKGYTHLPDGVPITGIAGDQQAALFGQNCTREGECKVTFGTGSFLVLNTGSRIVHSKHRLLTTLGWQISGQKPVYALEGGAFICGAAVQWLRDQLGVIANSSEVESLAREVEDTGGIEFVPALTGLGAPHWDPEARGLILGLTRGSGKAHLARATLEAMALQNVDIIDAMAKDLKKPIRVLRVDGGAAKNNLLMQIQADFSGIRLERPKSVESTVLGAAYLAGIGSGLWNMQQIKNFNGVDFEFRPQWSKSQRDKRKTKWSHAIKLSAKYAQMISA